MAKDKLREDFVAILGDEVYINSNHEIIPTLWRSGYAAACGLMRTDDHHLIAKNYTVTLEGDRIVSLNEKPQPVESDILGCGTYVFTPLDIFDAIERTRPSARSGKVELTDAIGTLVAEGKTVFPLFLQNAYHNVNSVEDYNYANYAYRDAFFDTFKIGLVIPARNEAESIPYAIRDFVGKVDEVLVVDNSSTDDTRAVAEKAGCAG